MFTKLQEMHLYNFCYFFCYYKFIKLRYVPVFLVINTVRERMCEREKEKERKYYFRYYMTKFLQPKCKCML